MSSVVEPVNAYIYLQGCFVKTAMFWDSILVMKMAEM